MEYEAENQLVVQSKNHLVTQSNKLVEAQYQLTVYEQKIMLWLVSMIEPTDSEFKEYQISIDHMVKFLDLKNKDIYTYIHSILRGLRSKSLTIRLEGRDFIITGWVSSAKFLSKKNLVKLRFGEELRPYLLQLKNNFTQQRLRRLIQFKSIYTIRLYALLKQYEKIGVREFSLEELKMILGIEDKYSEFRNFKRVVLSTAQKELSKKNKQGLFVSDLNFKLETEKLGRKIHLLRFIIVKQKTSEETLELPSTTAPQTLEYQELMDVGIQHEQALAWFEQYGQNYIREKIDFIKAEQAQGNIKSSAAGFLIAAINDDYKSEKELLREKQARERAEKARQERIAKLREKAALEFEKTAKQVYLDSLTEEERQDLLDEILNSKILPSFITAKIRKDGLNSPFAFTDIIQRIENFSENKARYIEAKLEEAGLSDCILSETEV